MRTRTVRSVGWERHPLHRAVLIDHSDFFAGAGEVQVARQALVDDARDGACVHKEIEVLLPSDGATNDDGETVLKFEGNDS